MNTNIVYVRRLKDGVVLDIPRRDLEATLKRGFELVADEPAPLVQEEEVKSLQTPVWMCTLCEKEYKTEKALEKHTKTIHR